LTFSPEEWYYVQDWRGGTAWADHARGAGLAVDATPRLNDIVVWPRTSSSSGHAAYVESVAADGSSFSVSEMNAAGGKGVVSYRTIQASAIAAQSLQFIH
jgi:surface antigen